MELLRQFQVQAQGIGFSEEEIAFAAPPVANAPEVLSPEQAAERLGVEVCDILSAIESGELKGRKIGSQVRITKAALDDFLAH